MIYHIILDNNKLNREVIMPTTTPKWKSAEEISFTASKRTVSSVFLHCSASDVESADDVSVMEKWHKKRGFSGVGYHFFINKNGDIQEGRDIEKIPAAQKGHNTGTIAICLHGLKIDKFTQKQYDSVKKLCIAIDTAYADTKIRFRGHTEVSNKTCPVFDYKTVLGLDSKGHRATTSSTTTVTKKSPSTSTKKKNVMEITDRGENIKALQVLLNSLGNVLITDGAFGQATYDVVKNFQRSHQLVEDGIVGLKTRAKLLTAAGNYFFTSTTTLKQGSKGNEVRSLQYVLLNHGETQLTPDNSFGVNTRRAVINVQTKLRLKPDGVVGQKTRNALKNKNFVKSQFYALNAMAFKN